MRHHPRAAASGDDGAQGSVHPPRRDAAHPGLLDHRDQGLLRGLPGLKKGREVTSLSQLRDAELQAAHARVERAVAVAVAIRCALAGALVAACADHALHVRLHQELHDGLGHAAQTWRARRHGHLRLSPAARPAVVCPRSSGPRSVRDEASQLHPSQPIRWPPPLIPLRTPNSHHERGHYHRNCHTGPHRARRRLPGNRAVPWCRMQPPTRQAMTTGAVAPGPALSHQPQRPAPLGSGLITARR